MKVKRKKKCLHCKCLYKPCKYNWDRQGYCLKPECQSERKKQCQKKWLSKQENKNWFSGSENTQRVQEWRKKNPGYWKRGKKIKPLQDSAFSQVIEKDEVMEQEQQHKEIALQDFANSQLFLITGLISHITGEPLQDSVVRKMRHFIIKGQSLLDHKNEMKGVCNGEKIASSRSTA